jgi:hypothetical protein
MFWFKRKKIIVDCLTFDKTIYEYSQLQKAIKFYPDWWKKLPNEYYHGVYTVPTMKRCHGLIDNYAYGFILPLWSDLNLIIKDRKIHQWQYADGFSEAVIHDSAQMGDYMDGSEAAHIKLTTPWRLKSKSEVPFHCVQPYWNYKPFAFMSMPSGIINFKYQPSLNVNMFINVKENSMIELKFGTPLLHIIPLTEKEVVLKHHLVDVQEYKSMRGVVKFAGNYKEIKKKKQEKERKCPFH